MGGKLRVFLSMLVLGLSSTAEADLVTYAFQGQITTFTASGDLGGINLGDSFFGSFQYDTSLTGPDGRPGDPSWGDYSPAVSPLNNLSVTVEGWTFSGSPTSIAARNNYGIPAVDELQVSLSGTGLPAGWSASAFSAFALFEDSTTTVFSNDSIPMSFNPAAFDRGIVQFRMTSAVVPGGIAPVSAMFTGTIDLAAVPEPSSILLTAGAAALGLLRVRRNHFRR
jgi:hypothetical protein